MSDKKNVEELSNSDELVIAKAKDFWGKYSKPLV